MKKQFLSIFLLTIILQQQATSAAAASEATATSRQQESIGSLTWTRIIMGLTGNHTSTISSAINEGWYKKLAEEKPGSAISWTSQACDEAITARNFLLVEKFIKEATTNNVSLQDPTKEKSDKFCQEETEQLLHKGYSYLIELSTMLKRVHDLRQTVNPTIEEQTFTFEDVLQSIQAHKEK